MSRELTEIKKIYANDNCSANILRGCYVGIEKNIKAAFHTTFLTLEDTDRFKYLDVFRKILSGTPGKNMLPLPVTETPEKKVLKSLVETMLKNDMSADLFFRHVIETFSYTGPYLILLLSQAYDVPLKGTDKKGQDESEEVYSHIICSICPVSPTKDGLVYIQDKGRFGSTNCHMAVNAPICGFLYPGFVERSADYDICQYYVKSEKEMHTEFLDAFFHTGVPAISVSKPQIKSDGNTLSALTDNPAKSSDAPTNKEAALSTGFHDNNSTDTYEKEKSMSPLRETAAEAPRKAESSRVEKNHSKITIQTIHEKKCLVVELSENDCITVNGRTVYGTA